MILYFHLILTLDHQITYAIREAILRALKRLVDEYSNLIWHNLCQAEDKPESEPESNSASESKTANSADSIYYDYNNETMGDYAGAEESNPSLESDDYKSDYNGTVYLYPIKVILNKHFRFH
jgi:hypothetical protein